jgi:hypothetical protein
MRGIQFLTRKARLGHILTQLSWYPFQLLIYIKWWQFYFNIQQFCVILLLQPLLIIFTDSAEIFRYLNVPFPYFNSNYAYCTKQEPILNFASLTFPASSSSFYNISTLWEKLVVSSVFEALLEFIEFPGHACCINNGFLIKTYCVIKLVQLYPDEDKYIYP